MFFLLQLNHLGVVIFLTWTHSICDLRTQPNPGFKVDLMLFKKLESKSVQVQEKKKSKQYPRNKIILYVEKQKDETCSVGL